MLKCLIVLAITTVAVAQCCEKSSFNDVEIRAFKDFKTEDEADYIKIEQPFTGCLAPTEEDKLKDAVQIVIKNQQVKVLFPGAVEDLQWLQELKLEENGIEEIKPGAFKKLPTIVSISLVKNQLKEIPEGIFNNMDVKRLFLNDNKISKIAEGAFDNMTNLNRIDLDNNKLKEWNNNWFTNTPKINFLSVTSNQIRELPYRAFKNFKGKHEEPGKSPVITSIFLSNNEIEYISPDAFKDLQQLDYLDLGNNFIRSRQLDKNVFAKLESIKYLLLYGNTINCLSEDFLDALPTTEIIDIDDNLVNCICLKNMKKWAVKHTVNIKITNKCTKKRNRNLD